MIQGTKVEIEEGLFKYVSRMRKSFLDAELELFPRLPGYDCKRWNEFQSAGAISVRQIDRMLSELCSSAVREKCIVTSAMFRDKVVKGLSQVTDARLAAEYQKFLQRDPAEVIGKLGH